MPDALDLAENAKQIGEDVWAVTLQPVPPPCVGSLSTAIVQLADAVILLAREARDAAR